jgi:uncharacterized Tic20 family protein
MNQLKKLLNIKIFLATASNICAILVLTGLIGQVEANTAIKIIGLIGATLIQIGIMTDANVI